ncbi:MAG: ATP-binding cassette domain-containing protein [Chitinophagaceae bacterium]|nr:ATP-binding cassette domain-containing protein [Chitinophagaceae bacterium]
MVLELKNIYLKTKTGYRLQDISLSLVSGKHHVIMGPNGAGKSSLLDVVSGSLIPSSGIVLLEGIDIKTYDVKNLSTRRAILSQQIHLSFPMKVIDVINLGCYPHEGRSKKQDEIAVSNIIQLLNIQHLENRWYQTLSGGEAQKVQLARAMVQLDANATPTNKLLLLDEPIAHLDPQYQQEILFQINQLVEKGITVVSVLHDINLALQFGDQLHFMKESKLLHSQQIDEPFTNELFNQIFSIKVQIERQPVTGRPYIMYQ